MRNWERPMVVVDTFAANEFVSACGDENKVYLFECNAGEKSSKYDVFTDDGINLTPGKRRYYHPCDAKHEAKVDSDFISGYMVHNHGNDNLYYHIPFIGNREYTKTKVIIWTDNGTNVHCTTNLDTNTWTTAKS